MARSAEPTSGPAETATVGMPTMGGAHRVDPDPPALRRDRLAAWFLSTVVLAIATNVVAGWFTEPNRWAGGLLAALVVLVIIATRPTGILSRAALGPTPLGRLATAICGAGFIAGSVWVSMAGWSVPAMLATVAALWLMTVLLGWRSLPPKTTLAMVAGGSAVVLMGVAFVLLGVGWLVERGSLVGGAVVLAGTALILAGLGRLFARRSLFGGALVLLGVALVLMAVGSLFERGSLSGGAGVLAGVAAVLIGVGLLLERWPLLLAAALVLFGLAAVLMAVGSLFEGWPLLFGAAAVLVGVAAALMAVGMLLFGRRSLVSGAVVLVGVAAVLMAVGSLFERWPRLLAAAVVLVGVASVLMGVGWLAAGRVGLSWSRVVRWWTQRLDDPDLTAAAGRVASGDAADADQPTVSADSEGGPPIAAAIDVDQGRDDPVRDHDLEDER